MGWARVINSVPLLPTSNITEGNGFIRLGDYTYPNTLQEFTSDYGTDEICKNNGEKVMFQAYSLLKAGDGIVYFTSAGHVVMISQDAVVVKKSDGSIDPDESYVLVIDQTPGWKEDTAESGDFFKYQKNVDAKWTFTDLYKGNYLPFTYPEWTGADPIEETEVKFSHTGDTITVSKLHSGKITSNYYIFDIYAQVFDSNGNEIYKLASRTHRSHSKELKFYRQGETIDTWGSLDNLKADETYTVKVYAVNSWAKESAPLVLDFTTKAAGDDIQADVLSVSFRQDGTAVNALSGEVLNTFGAPTVSKDEALGKYVATFDGTDDAYTYGSISSWYGAMAKGFSIETYVYLESKPSSGFMDFAANLNSAGFGVAYKNDGKLYFYCHAGGSYATPSFAIDVGQWVHVVGTFDGKNAYLYVNGQLAMKTPASGTLKAPTPESCFFAIGADTGKNNEALESFFKGKIADVNIYSAELSSEQIQKLYNAYK